MRSASPVRSEMSIVWSSLPASRSIVIGEVSRPAAPARCNTSSREVAVELAYSERTVKNVLHDVVTKLNARSRSQAVAFAVREGLI